MSASITSVPRLSVTHLQHLTEGGEPGNSVWREKITAPSKDENCMK